jgi:hypothetical protein
MIAISVIDILPHAYLLHFLLPMLQQTDLHCPVTEHIATETVFLHLIQ